MNSLMLKKTIQAIRKSIFKSNDFHSVRRNANLLFAIIGRTLILPEHHGSLGLWTALKESAAVLHAIHSFIQEG